MYGGRRGRRRGADADGLHRAGDRHDRAAVRARRAARLRRRPGARDRRRRTLERAADGLEFARRRRVLVRPARARCGTTRRRSCPRRDRRDGSRWCAERRPLAVGADNVAWDVPGETTRSSGRSPGHLILLVREGIYIIEALTSRSWRADGVREFAFACLPLKLRGGTGSPGTARSRWCSVATWRDPLLPAGPGPLHLGRGQRAGAHDRPRRHRRLRDPRRQRQPDRARLRRERDRRPRLGPRLPARRPDRRRRRRARRHARGRDPRHPHAGLGLDGDPSRPSGCCPRTSPTPTCASSTSPTATSRTSATTSRSRSTPFFGTMGVCPAGASAQPVMPPGTLRRQHGHAPARGRARRSTCRCRSRARCSRRGDAHGCQGDGEVCVTGLEAPMYATLRFRSRRAASCRRRSTAPRRAR